MSTRLVKKQAIRRNGKREVDNMVADDEFVCEAVRLPWATEMRHAMICGKEAEVEQYIIHNQYRVIDKKPISYVTIFPGKTDKVLELKKGKVGEVYRFERTRKTSDKE